MLTDGSLRLYLAKATLAFVGSEKVAPTRELAAQIHREAGEFNPSGCQSCEVLQRKCLGVRHGNSCAPLQKKQFNGSELQDESTVEFGTFAQKANLSAFQPQAVFEQLT